MKHSLFFLGLFLNCLFAQTTPNEYYSIVQKDSLYYLLTDNSLLKFYSVEASGEFFLTNNIGDSFLSSALVRVNDEHLFITYHDTIVYYSNQNAWDLTFEGVFVPGYSITSLHPFGPYFFIRSGNIYHLLKAENGAIITVEDSLFNHPGQYLVFFTYPYIVIAGTVYKYVEGFDFYAVSQVSVSNVNTGITGNMLVAYFYWISGPFPGEEHSELRTVLIEEPYFPHNVQSFWGINIPQLHINFGNGLMIARKNLYFMTWAGVITTHDSQLAYLPTSEDRATITDYYIFLLGSDTLKYSKWNAGSTFYPFTWTDLTIVQESEEGPRSYALAQNYPNPFNPVTTIEFSVPQRSLIEISIINLLGEEIDVLVNEEKSIGNYKIEFNGNNLPSGVYFYRIRSEDFVQTKKMVLLK